MAIYDNLRITVNATIYANSNEEINAVAHNAMVQEMIDELGALQTRGLVEPADNPGVMDGPAAFFASMPGTYSNFGNKVVAANELRYFKFDGDGGWTDDLLLDLDGVGFVQSVSDGNSIDFTVSSADLTAEVKLDTTGNNDLSIVALVGGGLKLDVSASPVTDTHDILGGGVIEQDLQDMIDQLALGGGGGLWTSGTGNEIYYDLAGGNVGIGNSNPTVLFHVGDLLTDRSGNSGVLLNRNLNTAAANGHGFSDSSTWQANAGQAYASYDARGLIVGTNAVDHVAAFQSAFEVTGTNTITTWYGFQDNCIVSAAATITDRKGIYIKNPALSGGGVVTNNYAIDIPAQTAGTTENFAIRTNSGRVQFGDLIEAENGIIINSANRQIGVNGTTGITADSRLLFEGSLGQAFVIDLDVNAAIGSESFKVKYNTVEQLLLDSNGALTLSQYASGQNGTPAEYIARDSTGKFINRSFAEVLSDIGAGPTYTAGSGIELATSTFKLGHSSSGSGVSDFTENRWVYINTFDLVFESVSRSNQFVIDASTGNIGIGTATAPSLLTINESTAGANAQMRFEHLDATSGGSHAVISCIVADTGGEAKFQVSKPASTWSMGMDNGGSETSLEFSAASNMSSTVWALTTGGALRWHNYGSTTFTGTLANYIAVDSSGNVIERTPAVLLDDINLESQTTDLMGWFWNGTRVWRNTGSMAIGTSTEFSGAQITVNGGDIAITTDHAVKIYNGTSSYSALRKTTTGGGLHIGDNTNFNRIVLDCPTIIGSTTIDGSALLQLVSTTQGFVPPKMTGTQAEAISTPLEGIMVYSIDGSGSTITSKGWWGYDGSSWVKLN